jgi:hypothetical protein
MFGPLVIGKGAGFPAQHDNPAASMFIGRLVSSDEVDNAFLSWLCTSELLKRFIEVAAHADARKAPTGKFRSCFGTSRNQENRTSIRHYVRDLDLLRTAYCVEG